MLSSVKVNRVGLGYVALPPRFAKPRYTSHTVVGFMISVRFGCCQALPDFRRIAIGTYFTQIIIPTVPEKVNLKEENPTLHFGFQSVEFFLYYSPNRRIDIKTPRFNIETGRNVYNCLPFCLFDERPHDDDRLPDYSEQIYERDADSEVEEGHMYGEKHRPHECRDDEIVVSRVEPYGVKYQLYDEDDGKYVYEIQPLE